MTVHLSFCIFVLSCFPFVLIVLFSFFWLPVGGEANVIVHLSFFCHVSLLFELSFFPFFGYLLMVRQM